MCMCVYIYIYICMYAYACMGSILRNIEIDILPHLVDSDDITSTNSHNRIGIPPAPPLGPYLPQKVWYGMVWYLMVW